MTVCGLFGHEAMSVSVQYTPMIYPNVRHASKLCFFLWRRKQTYLFVELVDDPLRPLQMQLLTLQRPIDICQLDAHLTHQQSVIFVGPVNTGHSFITHLWECVAGRYV